MKYLLSLFCVFVLFSCQSSAQNSKHKDVDVAASTVLMQDKDIVILDVRTPKEIAQGKIEGAVEINWFDGDSAEKIKTLDKNKTYLVYCKSGGRSGKCVNMMSDAGFESLYNLEGGYTAWVKANK